MAKNAPAPIMNQQVNPRQSVSANVTNIANNMNVEQTAADQQQLLLSEVQIEIREEHQNLSLKDLNLLSKQLLTQHEELMATRRSVDEVIAQRHTYHKQLQSMSQLTPEELEGVNSGELQLQEVLQQKQERQSQERLQIKQQRQQTRQEIVE